MLLDVFFETLSEFAEIIKKKFIGIYQNSSLYEKKISKTFDNEFIYKPSPHLLSSIIKYQNKKYKIEDFELETVWNSQIKRKDFEKLNNFFWLFSLDLKSSKNSVKKVIAFLSVFIILITISVNYYFEFIFKIIQFFGVYPFFNVRF